MYKDVMWVSYNTHRLDICSQKGATYHRCHRISQYSVFWVCTVYTSYVWSVVISFALDWPVSAEQATFLSEPFIAKYRANHTPEDTYNGVQ